MTAEIRKEEILIIKKYLEKRLSEIKSEVWDRCRNKVRYALDDPNVSEDEKWKIEARSRTLDSIAYGIENELDLLDELEKKL